MPPGLDSTGLTIKSQEEILEDYETDQLAGISPELDLEISSPLGQVNAVVSRSEAQLWEAVGAVYDAMDPETAVGDALDRLCAITGTRRRAGTSTRVTATVTLAAGTYAIGALVAYLDGDPTKRFSNVDAITTAGGDEDTDFEAEEVGPIHVPADTLIRIASPVTGWTAITNDDEETSLGTDRETDAALRLRRAFEVANPGGATVNGLRADVLENVPEVTLCNVINNPTDATVDTVPPHAVEVIAYGPASPSSSDDQNVAEAIFEGGVAAGIATAGNTTKTVVDDQGFSHTIKFTRPTTLGVDATIELEYDAETYAGDAAVEEAVTTGAAETMYPGLDIASSQIAAWVHTVPGVLRVTEVDIESLGPWNVVAATRRQIIEVNPIVTSTPADP